jgi:hypothetical protein
MLSGATSTFEFNGSTPQTLSAAYTSGESFNSIILNNSAGLTITNGDIKTGAAGTLNCTSGVLTTGSNKVMLGAAATITESASSYVLGNVQTTRTLTSAAETFGGMGLSIDAASAPGITTVLRITGNSNTIGCTAKSVQRTFTVTNANTNLNALIAYTFVPSNELNGLTQSALKLFDVTSNAAITGSTIAGNTITVSGQSSIEGIYSAAIASPVLVITNPAAVCSPSTVDLTAASVTAGSEAGTLTYFTNSAATNSLANPSAVGAGTYYIKSTNTSGCSTVQPVIATVTNPLAPSVTIQITTGSNPSCSNGSVRFTANPVNAGATPTYQWFINGVANPDSSGATFTVRNITTAYSPSVYVVLTVSPGTCATSNTATSATTTLSTQDNSWTGSFSNNWNDGRNWCSGTVPTAVTDVVIPVTTRNPVLLSNSVVRDIEIQPGAYLDLSGRTLSISGAVTNTGYLRVTTASTLNLSGTTGTLYFDPAYNSLNTLMVNGTASLGNALNIYGSITVTSGTLTTLNNLTLKSVLGGTASVGNSPGTITGNVTVERYIPGFGRRAWRMLSIPTAGSQTINAAWQEGQTGLTNTIPGYGTLLTSTTGTANGYDATTAGNSLLTLSAGNPGSWVGIPSTNSPIATTAGYMLYMRGDRSANPFGGPAAQTATTLRTTGPLYQGNQGVINIPANTNVLVGNIYASAIDFTTLARSTGNKIL